MQRLRKRGGNLIYDIEFSKVGAWIALFSIAAAFIAFLFLVFVAIFIEIMKIIDSNKQRIYQRRKTDRLKLQEFLNNDDKYTVYKGEVMLVLKLYYTEENHKIIKTMDELKLFNTENEALIYNKIQEKKRRISHRRISFRRS